MPELTSRARDLWSTVRYGALLPRAARSRGAGRAYARAVAAIELRLDGDRRRAAVTRIGRALGVDARAALDVFRGSLVSEAREEADSTYFMQRDAAELCAACTSSGVPPVGPAVYATLHFGSPILCYLYLHLVRKVAIHIIGRKLDDTNPMPAAKRAFGMRKVAWVQRLAERPFVDVDAASIARMRGCLLDGESAYAAIDVPGDVVARRITVDLLGERVVLSAGVPTLARLARVPMQPIVAVSRPAGIEIQYGEPVDASADAAADVLVARMADRIRATPSEWWMWPYLTPARE